MDEVLSTVANPLVLAIDQGTPGNDGALPLRFAPQHMHLFDPASGQRVEF